MKHFFLHRFKAVLICLAAIISWHATIQAQTISPIFPNSGTCIPSSATGEGYQLLGATRSSNYVWSVLGDLTIDSTSSDGLKVYVNSTSTDPTGRPQAYGKGRVCVTYYDTATSTICGNPRVCYDVYKDFTDTMPKIVGPICINEGDTVTYSIKAMVSVNISQEIGIDRYYWSNTSGLVNRILYYSGDSSSITFVAGALTGHDTLFVDMGQCNLSDGFKYTLPIGQALDTPQFITGHAPPTCLPFNADSVSIYFTPQAGVTYTWNYGGWKLLHESLLGDTLILAPANNAQTLILNASNTCQSLTLNYTINRSLSADNAITPDSTCYSSGQNVQFGISNVAAGTAMDWTVIGTGWSIASGGNTTTPIITVGTDSGRVIVSTASCPDTKDTLIVHIRPNTPGTITGSTCLDSTNIVTYSISAVAHATSYQWYFPTGWSSIGSTTSTSVTLIPDGTTIGNVRVIAIGCSSSDTASLPVKYNPRKPGSISSLEWDGVTPKGCYNSGMPDSVLYSITPKSGEKYQWDIPGGLGSIISYTDTFPSGVYVVTAGDTGTYIVRVRSYNSCDTSAWDTLSVTISGVNFSITPLDLGGGVVRFTPSPNPVPGVNNSLNSWTWDGTGSIAITMPTAIYVSTEDGSEPVGTACLTVVDPSPNSQCFTRKCTAYPPPGSMRPALQNTKDQFSQNVQVFPNPASSTLNLVFANNDNYSVQLIDNTGKKVLTEQVSGRVQQLDVSHVANGTYLLFIQSPSFTGASKVVISK